MDTPTADSHWQWNRNVSIEKFYSYLETSNTRLVLSNGEVCYITKQDEQLFSTALAMHAQEAVGEFICELDNSMPFEGKTARRAHRIMMK